MDEGMVSNCAWLFCSRNDNDPQAIYQVSGFKLRKFATKVRRINRKLNTIKSCEQYELFCVIGFKSWLTVSMVPIMYH